MNTLLNQSDLELLKKAQEGDAYAFKELVKQNQKYVYAVSFKILGDENDSKEVVQECFVKVWKNLKQFNFKNKFTTWIYKITVNTCYDKLRERQRKHELFTDFEESETLMSVKKNFGVSHQIENEDLVKLIGVVSNQLAPKQRIVFSLRDLQGFSIEEVCEITEMSESSVKTNLVYARKAVKEKLIKWM